MIGRGAIALGRRRRRRATLGTAVAVVTELMLLGVALVPLVGPGRAVRDGELSAAPALPDRRGSPALLPASVSSSPPGPAGLVFTERPGALTGSRLVTVGASDDTYRVIGGAEADPGRTALLSPDGGHIAYNTGNGVVVMDLGTGQRRTYPSPDLGADDARPAAWLPDGRGLVALTITYAKDPTTEGSRSGWSSWTSTRTPTRSSRTPRFRSHRPDSRSR